MADKKIIAVTGATGARGGGLVRAILADPDGGFAGARDLSVARALNPLLKSFDTWLAANKNRIPLE